MRSTKKTEKIATFPGNPSQNITPIIAPETLETQHTQDFLDIEIENSCQTLEEFKLIVKDSFLKGSGIAPELYAESVEFYSEVEFDPWGEATTPINDLLNWQPYKKSWSKKWGPGIESPEMKPKLFAAILRNEDGTVWQGIVSIPDKDAGRPYRYLAPKGNGDRLFRPPVPKTIREKTSHAYGVEVPLDGSFWEWLETAKLPRILTEGAKKALKLLSHGYIGIAMYGCDCGGREAPTPDISKLNQSGTTWLFALDRDSKLSTKRRVQAARKRLAELLSTQSVVCIADIEWSAKDGKGVDDLIVSKGIRAFDLAYSKAIATTEKQTKSGGYDDSIDNEKTQLPKQAEIALKLANRYKGNLKFNDSRNTWIYYSHETIGAWAEVSDTFIERLTFRFLLDEYSAAFSNGYVNGIAKLLKTILFVDDWKEADSKEFLPFEDGVLKISTGELLPHSPEYHFTWQLPRTFANSGVWDNINQFLDDATQGDKNKRRILECFCNAVLKGRSELHKFLYLLGRPRSGKGTFMRLLISLIGKKNIVGTDLKQWNESRFETARAYGKRLVVFSEQAPYPEDISKFLSLTGQDPLRLERKGKDADEDFYFPGLTLMCGNLMAFSGQNLNAVLKRMIMVKFDKIVTESEVKDFTPLFEQELSAFTEYLLAIPDDEVAAVLTGKTHQMNEFDAWKERMKNDSVASWLNYHLIVDPLAKTYIGNNKLETADGRKPTTFYGSYTKYCLESGVPPMGSPKFSPNLTSLLEFLGWPFVKIETNKGTYIEGIRLRTDGFDDHIPSLDMILGQKLDRDEVDDVGSGRLSGRFGGQPQPLPSEDSGQGGQLFEKLAEKKIDDCVVDSDHLTQEQHLEHHEPVAVQAVPQKEERFEIQGFAYGDKVVILKHEQKPEIVGSVQIINRLGNSTCRFESGEYVMSYEDIRHFDETPSTQLVQPAEPAPIDKFACPQPDEYYRDFPAKPFKFTIDTHYGACEVTARPFKKIKSTGESEIHLLYEMDMGRTAERVKCKLEKKVIQRLSQESAKRKALEEAVAKQWVKRAEKETYRVFRDENWIENCKLTVVPKHFQQFFIFETPDGQKVHCTAGMFEPMPKI
ncbi:DUF3854 domain-containing protein [Anabaena azotica]|uniref:DUF3854 domain-containing protein n=1 Tax=Anabaena azotica TaxID=197653 RepID=UPI0039A6ADB8